MNKTLNTTKVPEPSDEYRRGYEAGKSVADEARAELKACREAFDLATRYGRPAGDALDAARWRHAVANWRVTALYVMDGVRLTNAQGISWDVLTRQADTALQRTTAREGE